MELELRQLSPDDGKDVYKMISQIPAVENGFHNDAAGLNYEEYREWLANADQRSRQQGILDGMAPETFYWLFKDGTPIGIGRLRHELTDSLRQVGGNIGYAVIPSERGMGYGKTLLSLMLSKAREHGLSQVLITVQNHNTASMKVAEANGGRLDRITDTRHYYWIQL